MSDRQLISSGGPWEAKVGYSRAVRVGKQVFVSGTVASLPDGTIACPGDIRGQCRVIFTTIAAALAEAGATMADVVRVRSFITDIRRWEGFGEAHGEFFSDVRPASTMVEVSALMTPDCLIEIEVDAVLT